jgi:Protein of unknown function (DUF4238)
MASNKNQHFVPRCYLRPFTAGGDGKAIHLVNLDLEKAIFGAPVKGQCSGDYFYGDDLVLEKRLQAFEGLYATRLAAILTPDYRLTDEDSDLLREFWVLQHMRTEAASRAVVEIYDQMEDEIGPLPAGAKTDIKGAVRTAMKIFFEVRGVLSDLNVRLIRNLTDRPFITSDDPAVMTNRWHLTDARVKGIAPGLQNAGMTGLLPLSPKLMAVIYDGDLHSLPHLYGWLDLTSKADVDAFNEHQVLNCYANLYFGDPAHADYATELAARLAAGRPAARFVLEHLVLDHEDAGTKTYRVATADEAKAAENSIVHTAGVLPAPSSWPSQLKWRAGGSVYGSGTGAGFARKATRDTGVAYRKLRVRS